MAKPREVIVLTPGDVAKAILQYLGIVQAENYSITSNSIGTITVSYDADTVIKAGTPA